MAKRTTRKLKLTCLRAAAVVEDDGTALSKPMLVGFAKAADLNAIAKAPAFSETDPNAAIAGDASEATGPQVAAPARSCDHLFPRALGGPTDARNRLTLCDWHNTAKSMDVHIFPWEEGLPPWVLDVLQVLGSWLEPAARGY
jgi:hypothetical protein